MRKNGHRARLSLRESLLARRLRYLGYDTWFHPTVDIQRLDPNKDEGQRSFSKRPKADVILPGDLTDIFH